MIKQSQFEIRSKITIKSYAGCSLQNKNITLMKIQPIVQTKKSSKKPDCNKNLPLLNVNHIYIPLLFNKTIGFCSIIPRNKHNYQYPSYSNIIAQIIYVCIVKFPAERARSPVYAVSVE